MIVQWSIDGKSESEVEKSIYGTLREDPDPMPADHRQWQCGDFNAARRRYALCRVLSNFPFNGNDCQCTPSNVGVLKSVSFYVHKAKL